MKSLSLSLLATLVGLAMLVVGIAGVAGAFESDEDSGSSSTDSVSNFDGCPTADDRFEGFTTIELTGSGGTASVLVTCQEPEIQLSLIGSVLPTEESRTVALWLYNDRKDAELVGSSQQEATGEDRVYISGELPLSSQNYEKLVVTESPPLDDFEEPTEVGRVIMQARP
jgi:hypothetical protein